VKFLTELTTTAELHAWATAVTMQTIALCHGTKNRSRALRFDCAHFAPAMSRSNREDDFFWIFFPPSSLLAVWIEKVEG
jgi:hypothetical protein